MSWWFWLAVWPVVGLAVAVVLARVVRSAERDLLQRRQWDVAPRRQEGGSDAA